MTHQTLRHMAIYGVVVLLAACSKPPEAPVEVSQAPAATVDAAAAAPAVSSEQATALKQFIEKDGNQCAEVVRVQNEELSSKITVTCADAAGNKSDYVIDMNSEQAQKVG